MGVDRPDEGAIMGVMGGLRMECYLYEGERLVFEGEGWGIIIDDGHPSRAYHEGFVYGTHQVCTVSYDPERGAEGAEADRGDEIYSYGENCWEPRTAKAAVCGLCEAAVPDGVQGLILMQRWDRGGT